MNSGEVSRGIRSWVASGPALQLTGKGIEMDIIPVKGNEVLVE